MEKGYIIGTVCRVTGKFSISDHPNIYPSAKSAKEEAEKFAISYPEIKYIVFSIVGICSAVSVVWE